MSLAPGTRLGSYEIVTPLGAGGMGEVYRAKDARLGREVAIKVLPEATAADPDRRQRFEQEARSASALNHPNILTIYDIGQSNGTVYIAMELIEGKTLRELVASGEPLPTKKLLDVAVQTAEGLAKAHGAGIVHRDLKPENIMISRDGFAKILDFGLAKLSEAPSQDQSVVPTAIAAPTQPGTVMGTAGYMSPEQASGQPVDFRSDQFTLGTILYEMATGKRAFQRKTGAETLVAIIREEPEPLSQAAPKAPAPVRWIVERCLAKDPEERYASTKDLARDLKSLRDHLSETSLSASGSLQAAEAPRVRRRGWLLPAALALLLGTGLGVLLRSTLLTKPAPPVEFQRLTFQRGRIPSARFAPDGLTIVYSAAWEGAPLDIYTTRSDSTEFRSLGLPGAELLAVSSTGEIAVALHRRFIVGFEATGTLARVPLAGGAPREILQGVQSADFSPDGKELAVTRVVGNRSRLEYPIGKVVYETPGWLSGIRVSPDGKLLAFIEHPQRGNNDGSLRIVDTSGKLRLADGPSLSGFTGMAWTPAGDEVWWGHVQATSVSGRTRSVLSAPHAFLLDLAKDGRALVNEAIGRREIIGVAGSEASPRNLSALNWSFPTDISNDGRMVLFGEQQRRPPGIYLRQLDGSPAVRIGEGEGFAISPDGLWVLGSNATDRRSLQLIPTGAGETKTLPLGDLTCQWGAWMPDNRQIVFNGSPPGGSLRLYLQAVEGGAPRPAGPEGFSMENSQGVSPDGRLIAGRGPDGRIALFPIEGGALRPLTGLEPEDVPTGWTSDGKGVYVTRLSGLPGSVQIFDIATGKRTPWKSYEPPDPTGVEVAGPIVIAPDGKSYVYSYRRELDELFLATGMR
jgi:serine/threonine protein kinase/Tol biopolymer transport system component